MLNVQQKSTTMAVQPKGGTVLYLVYLSQRSDFIYTCHRTLQLIHIHGLFGRLPGFAQMRLLVFWGTRDRVHGVRADCPVRPGPGGPVSEIFPRQEFSSWEILCAWSVNLLIRGLLWCVTCVVGLFSYSLHLHLRKIVLMASRRECADEDEAADRMELTRG